ncbi:MULTISPECIES: VanZ family protein [Paenibacillus]|uniref:VanZ family protein n=1 Tax=Paenibacillus TaxID=44249 RepID=UPI00038060CD|nr:MULTISPECIES: VanZ family protein [Paenibacillus]
MKHTSAPTGRHNKNGFRIIPFILLVTYLYLLTQMILFKGGPIDPGLIKERLLEWLQQPDLIYTRTINLTPFQEISRDWSRLSLHPTGTSIQLIGNVLAFVPLGMFIPLLMRHPVWSGILVLPISLLLSLIYEGTQLLTGMGIFDVDDLMLNTAGGIIGYVLFATAVWLGKWLIGSKSSSSSTIQSAENGIS